MTLSDDKKTLVFLVESPFSERDWDRFGIASDSSKMVVTRSPEI